MERLLLKDVLGMYTVQRQALHGGIIRVLQIQFLSCLYFLIKFISPAYEHCFMSVNYVICNIGCFKQTR